MIRTRRWLAGTGERARRRTPATATATAAAKDRDGDGDGDAGAAGYSARWRPADEAAARQLIVTYEDEERFEFTGRQEAERLLPHVRGDATVLDLGCGIGRIALYIAPHCARLWAVDVSAEMLAMARRRLVGENNVRFATCSGTRVPDVETGSVDFLYSIIVLQHLEREDAFLLLEECVRMLRPGGSAFITWPNIADPEYLQSFVDYAHNGDVADRARARMYTTTELAVLLPRAGFSAVEVHDAPNIVTVCTR